MKRQHDHDNSCKRKHLTRWVAYSFIGSALYQHYGEHDRVQVDAVLEQLRVLRLTGNGNFTNNHTEGSLTKRDRTLPPTMLHLLIVPFPVETTFF